MSATPRVLVPSGPTLPATCSPGPPQTDLFKKTAAPNAGLYIAIGPDQWGLVANEATGGVLSINSDASLGQTIQTGDDDSEGEPFVETHAGVTTIQIPDATPVTRGLINSTLQSFAGNKTWNGSSRTLGELSGNSIVCGDRADEAVGLFQQIMPNDTGAGTTQNRLAKLLNGKAVISTTADTGGILGAVQGVGGSSGVCAIAVGGVGQCDVDGAWVSGNYAIPSLITNGKVHDAGAIRPSSVQVIGRFVDDGGSAGIAHIYIYPAEAVYGSGGGGGSSDWGYVDPRTTGAIGDGVTIDTTAFLAMLTAIGSTPTVVKIPRTSGPFLLGNITFPSNVILDFTSGGSIKMIAARKANILGQYVAYPTQQVFYNAKSIAAGQGEVAFGNTSAINSRDGQTPQQKTFFVEHWGAVGNDVVHSADYIDAACLAIPDGSRLGFAGKFYYLEHGITCAYKFAITFIGNETEVGLGNNLVKPIFVYHGVADGNAVTLNNVYASTFKGFGVYCSDGGVDAGLGKIAKTAILVTYDNPSIGGNPSITSHCYFEGLNFYPLSARTDWTGILVSNVGGNNEHHTFRECEFAGQQDYTNITFGQCGINFAQTQVQRCVIERNNFSGLSASVSVTGNMMAYDNIHSNVATPWYMQQPNNNCLIMGDDIEVASRIIDVVQTNGPFTCVFIACKYGSIGAGATVGTSDSVANAPIRIRASGDISFYNCNMNNAGAPGQDFGPYLVGGPNDGATYPSVEFYNCLLGTTNNVNIHAPGFATCLTRWRKGTEDLCWGGPTGEPRNVLSVAPPTKGSQRRIIDLKGPTATTPADPLTIGGIIGIDGLYEVSLNKISVTGVTGAVLYHIAVIAVDSRGRRSDHRVSSFLSISNANATLTGSNYVTVSWFSQYPVPDHYEIYDVDTGNSANWRKIANFTPTGAFTESYNIVANPTGSFTATQPQSNESGIQNQRGTIIHPGEVGMADGDTTPSVAIGNRFLGGNSVTTRITTFDDPEVGKTIYYRCNDAFTVLGNTSTLITGTGLDINCVQGVSYPFEYRGIAWHYIGAPHLGETLLATVPLVDMNTATPTSLFTVPTGRICVITKIVVRNASINLTTVSDSFGWNSATYDDWQTGIVFATLTTSSNFRTVFALNGAKIGTSGQVFKVLNNVLQGAAATTTMEIFGYLV